MNWQAFVLTHGAGVEAGLLGAVLGQTAEDVRSFRAGQASRPVQPGEKPKSFSQLFMLWHGRAPTEAEWPAPRKYPEGYEWLEPEFLLLASLVGRSSIDKIAELLTRRLRHVTGDASARRTVAAVTGAMCRVGLVTKDVLGGITVKEAAKQCGNAQMVYGEIRSGRLEHMRVGGLLVIPHAAWNAYAKRTVFPPHGYVRLSRYREALGIHSVDMLARCARAGHIPTALSCYAHADGKKGARKGVWFVDRREIERVVADRRAGRPMPWNGRALPENVKAAYSLWVEKRHPATCVTCALIWGAEGAPADLDAYMQRYQALSQDARRHLTQQWVPGLTVAEVAARAHVPVARVTRAIESGALHCQAAAERTRYIPLMDAIRWIDLKCPAGGSERSWVAFGMVSRLFGFTPAEIEAYVASGRLESRISTHRSTRGIMYVRREQCAVLRDEIGYTFEEAAAQLGIDVASFLAATEGAHWRQEERVPKAALDALRKRREPRAGVSIEEAAVRLGQTVAWVQSHIDAGTVRVARSGGLSGRLTLPEPMIERLRKLGGKGPGPTRVDAEWVSLSQAAALCGVTSVTILRWLEKQEVRSQSIASGRRYHAESLKGLARAYWATARGVRREAPEWLHAEQARMAA